MKIKKGFKFIGKRFKQNKKVLLLTSRLPYHNLTEKIFTLGST